MWKNNPFRSVKVAKCIKLIKIFHENVVFHQKKHFSKHSAYKKVANKENVCDLALHYISKWLDQILFYMIPVFVLRFYGSVNPMGHVERGQFT